MGLFSFVKNAGAKLFGGSKEAKEAEAKAAVVAQEAKVSEFVRGLGLEVTGLNITVAGEKVMVSGEAKDQATREKVILAIGNVEGISEVDDRMTVKVEEPVAQFYTVQRGDSLSKIAKQHYGDAMKYPEIFEANKPMLKDPNLIYPGQVLRIPPLK
jgi:nucleoid-associated protein YgaU